MSRIANGFLEPEGARPLLEVLIELDQYDDDEWIYVQRVDFLTGDTLAVVTGPNISKDYLDRIDFRQWAEVSEVREAVDYARDGDLVKAQQRLIDLIGDFVG